MDLSTAKGNAERKSAMSRLNPWDDNLPTKFVEFEIKRKLKSLRRSMHVPSLSRIDEMLPTTNFVSELGNLAEFMYSVGKCVMANRPQLPGSAVTKEDEIQIVKKRLYEASSGEEDEGIGESGSSTLRPIISAEQLLAQNRLRLRKKRLSMYADGFLADEEDNDEDEESSGFYSDASECTTISNYSGRIKNFRHRAGLYYHSQLPPWLRNNEFILFGHRPPSYNFRTCFKSIFQLHTETGNIWTHMIGALITALYAIYFYFGEAIPRLDMGDHFVFGVFFTAATFCMGMSAVYHTLNCHSSRICNITCKMDFAGITVLIFGSFVPWLHFTFYCHPEWRLAYSAASTIAALVTIRISLSEEFAQAHYRGVRSAAFITYALICGVIPVFHYTQIYSFKELSETCHFSKFVLMVFFYVVGAVFYSLRVPEKYYPGKFDYAMQSHQIMHLCVILGNLAHYWGCHSIAVYRHDSAGSCPAGHHATTMYSVLEPSITWLQELLSF